MGSYTRSNLKFFHAFAASLDWKKDPWTIVKKIRTKKQIYVLRGQKDMNLSCYIFFILDAMPPAPKYNNAAHKMTVRKPQGMAIHVAIRELKTDAQPLIPYAQGTRSLTWA